MPKATAPLFGRLLRAFRNRAGLSQGTLAAYLHVAPATISRIETGRENPPEDPAFYEHLRAVSEFTEAEVTLLQELARHLKDLGGFAAFGEQYVPDLAGYLTTIDAELPEELQAYAALLTELSSQEESSDITQILQKLASISLLMPPPEVEHGDHLTSPPPDSQQGDPSTAQGTKPLQPGREQPANPPEQDQGVQKKGDIYQRRTRYDDAYLQEHIGQLSQHFNAALRNPEDPLNHAAKQGLHVFAETMAQTEGTSLSEAAREHDLPLASLSNWVRSRLVPTLYKDSHTIYIAKEAALKAAAVHQKARETGKRTASLLREIFKH
jgi:transcriptional regulator with XRE-family HTH domain